MRVLLVGVGTVGEAIARMCVGARLVRADGARRLRPRPGDRAPRALGDASRFPGERIDAGTPRPWPRWPGGTGSTW